MVEPNMIHPLVKRESSQQLMDPYDGTQIDYVRSQNFGGDRVDFSNIFTPVRTEFRKTKIMVTLGTACDSTETIVKLLDAGMNIARLNCAKFS